MYTTHCENCGTVNPETIDGYTACCNELLCDGRGSRIWATGTFTSDQRHNKTGTARGCCAAGTQAKLPKGTEVLWREN